MNEYLDEAKEEFKRVDHIIHVSLKYMRTVDVIRNALNRLISLFDWTIEALIQKLIEDKIIERSPKSHKVKCEVLLKEYKDPRLTRYITFYLFLRELIKAPYFRREEYRRHVTMIAQLKEKTAEVDIDNLEDNYEYAGQEFLDLAEILLGLKTEE